MTKAQEKEKEREEAKEFLREYLKPGTEVLCILRHRSRSGMQRVIDLAVVKDGGLKHLGWHAAKVLGWKYDTKRDGIVVGGCGMDMGFHTVHQLSFSLFPDGFTCLKYTTPEGSDARCPSNDHSNRVEVTFHKSGGYALRSRWI